MNANYCPRCKVTWRALWAHLPAGLCPQPRPGGRCATPLVSKDKALSKDKAS